MPKLDINDGIFADDEINEADCNCLGGWILVDGGTAPCPKCQRKSMDREVPVSEQIEKKAELKIPKPFLNAKFDKNILLNDETIHKEVRYHSQFMKYAMSLEDLNEKYLLGQQPTRSLLITAPQGYAKSNLVYSCINNAISKGMSVAPYLDTMQIYNLIRNNESHDFLYESDVCFIKLMAGLTTNRDTQAIKVVVDRRARNGLPTIIISRVPVYYILTIEKNDPSRDLFFNADFRTVPEYDYSRLVNISAPYLKDKKE